MTWIIIGVVGIIVSGFISKSLYAYAVEARRVRPGAPFARAVPAWVSLLFLASLGCAIYGVVKVLF
jgi:hypothetical protein